MISLLTIRTSICQGLQAQQSRFTGQSYREDSISSTNGNGDLNCYTQRIGKCIRPRGNAIDSDLPKVGGVAKEVDPQQCLSTLDEQQCPSHRTVTNLRIFSHGGTSTTEVAELSHGKSPTNLTPSSLHPG